MRVLIVEDSDDDARLLYSELIGANRDISYLRVDCAEDMRAALADAEWDIVISDHNLPHFSSLEALSLLKENGKDIPFIIYSGAVSEHVAVAAMCSGAQDSIPKGSFARLLAAIERELQGAAIRREKQEADHHVYQLAYYDSLTGLPNRNLFCNHVDQALLRAGGRTAAVYILDIDRFLLINNRFGYKIGDALIRGIGQRLQENVPAEGMVARVGSDEFAVFLADVGNDEDMHRAAENIRAALARPFVEGGLELLVTVSIGMALSPRDGKDMAELLINAETAMFRAKSLGRNNHQSYARDMCAASTGKMAPDGALRRPLEDGGPMLEHQPDANAATGQITGVQAPRANEAHLEFLANFDPVTALPNRSMFYQRLQRAVVHAQRYNKQLALLFIDLDRFKNINDTLGHDAGDNVLRTMATRLLGSLREADTVARLGGDEFVILIEEVTDSRMIAIVAQKLINAVAEPFMLGQREYCVTASIGISTYPADGPDGATLLKNADIAMYRAKEQGKNNSQFYAAAMNTHSLERLSLETSLRGALERDEFVLHFQPKVEIGSGQLTGMEALVRWRRPGAGMVSPSEFIPIAEETGLIVAIGEWVLKNACKCNVGWSLQKAPPLRVAVNLSARQFSQAQLVSDVAGILDVTGLAPEFLELEITESMVMNNPEQAIRTLHQLKSLGIYLALDDFGTGYSSLGYLKRFPLDYIKIDRSFIRDIPGNNDDATITKTIISMAHNLRLKVIAEGVETKAQYTFLREHDCDEIQGYYFSRPLPEAEFFALLQQRQRELSMLGAGEERRQH